MRALTDVPIPHIDTTDLASYPFGRFKNKSETPGTEASERTLGDVYQGMLEILRRAGITPDNLPDTKAKNQIADAIEFLNPVAIMKVGYNGVDAIEVLGGNFKEGYTAAYTTSTVSGADSAVTNKLTINKDAVVSTEDYFVSAVIARTSIAGAVVGVSHGVVTDFDYFDNDAGNIGIFRDGETHEVLQRMALVITVYKV